MGILTDIWLCTTDRSGFLTSRRVDFIPEERIGNYNLVLVFIVGDTRKTYFWVCIPKDKSLTHRFLHLHYLLLKNSFMFQKIIVLHKLFSLLILAVSFSGFQTTATAQKPILRETPEVVVSNFYKWYLHNLKANKDPFTELQETVKKYVSRPLRDRITKQINSPDGLDADYFLKAQDWLDDWEKTITTTGVSRTKSDVVVNVTMGGAKDTRHRLTVKLRQEDGIWKINDVRESH